MRDKDLEQSVSDMLADAGATQTVLNQIVHVTAFGPEQARSAIYAQAQLLRQRYPDTQFDFHIVTIFAGVS